MRALTAFSFVLLLAGAAGAQAFDAGSDGSDGALSFPAAAGLIVMDPATAGAGGTPIDVDGDNVFHFTTIDIPAGTTVKLIASNFGGEGRPVTWLASGDVTIEGILDLDGANGHTTSGPALNSVPGAGGWSGGKHDGTFRQAGNGPGGGQVEAGFIGYSAAHRGPGGAAGGANAQPYGNKYLLPLTGGSGGGAGQNVSTALGNGGGAGGGAILVASSTTITVNGTIQAQGGDGVGSATGRSGGGSGGAIRLVANTVAGTGLLDVRGGFAFYGTSSGYIRVQGFTNTLKDDGSFQPVSALTNAAPGLLFPPPDQPTVRITTIDGIAAPLQPTGSFETVDVTIDSPTDVTIAVEASKIPLGTTVQVRLFSEDGATQTLTSTPLAGTLDTSTATASATFPSGFTRVTVSATWTP